MHSRKQEGDPAHPKVKVCTGQRLCYNQRPIKQSTSMYIIITAKCMHTHSNLMQEHAHKLLQLHCSHLQSRAGVQFWCLHTYTRAHTVFRTHTWLIVSFIRGIKYSLPVTRSQSTVSYSLTCLKS